MLITDNFFYVSSEGEGLPNKQQLNIIRKQGKQIVFHIDSNICIYFEKTYTKPEQITKNIANKLDLLLSNIQQYQANISFGGAVFELSFNKNNWTLNKNKYNDLCVELASYIDISESKLFGTANNLLLDTSDYFSSIDVAQLLPLLQTLYAAYLKTATIALTHPSENNACNNLLNYINWLDETLNFFSPIPLQIAASVFAKDPYGNKAIFNKKKSPLQTCLGAAFDTWHLFLLNFAHLKKIDKMNHFPILVTNDKAFYKTIRKCPLLEAIKLNDEVITTYSAIDIDYKAYAHRQEEISSFFKTKVQRRAKKAFIHSKKQPLKQINLLEKKLQNLYIK